MGKQFQRRIFITAATLGWFCARSLRIVDEFSSRIALRFCVHKDAHPSAETVLKCYFYQKLPSSVH
jgi:hypothetical protein